ncbi:MAG TPA: SgcJ/EcaC family oxidoreductase [Longimicrobiales bacterium]|nr:SgcJ/EcaC family oxidoreductase [Longimicrobiales bacterium]
MITAVSTAELRAIVEGDVDAFAAVLAEDAVYMPPGEPAVSGKAAIRSWFESFLEVVSVDGSYPSSEVNITGDWAIERYTADLTLTPADGSEPMREVGKGIHVYRRGPDGSWKLTYDIWNFDSSPSEASDIQ